MPMQMTCLVKQLNQVKTTIKELCEVPTIKTQRAIGEDNMWKDVLIAKDLI